MRNGKNSALWPGTVVKILVPAVAIFAVLFIFGLRSKRPAARVALYQEFAAYIDARAFPETSVAVSEPMARYFQDHVVVDLPKQADAFGILSMLQATSPEYVIAWNGIVWDGVRANPWFLEHYRAVLEKVVPYDTATPLELFRYVPAPFDDGEFFPIWRTFSVSQDEAALELRALQLSHSQLEPGRTLYMTLIWGGDFFSIPDLDRWLVQLVAVNDERVWASVDFRLRAGWPAALMRVGEDVLSRHILMVPDALPPGAYHLNLALYLKNGKPVDVLDDASLPYVTLASLHRPPDVSLSPPSPDESVVWQLGEGITLVGYDMSPRVSPGEQLWVALYWYAKAEMLSDYKVFIHILDPSGQSWVQDDSRPLGWAYPTTQWTPGEYVRDVHILSLPVDLPRGNYTVAVGMYDAETSIRLPVWDDQGRLVPEERILLDSLRVR